MSRRELDEVVDLLAKRLARRAEEAARAQFTNGYVRTDWALSDVRSRFRAMARRDLKAIGVERLTDAADEIEGRS